MARNRRNAAARILKLVTPDGQEAGYLVLGQQNGTVPIGPFHTLLEAKRAQRNTVLF